MEHGERNWAGNVRFRAEEIHRPTALDQLRTLVAGSKRLRALGTRHSFNDIADSPGSLVSLAGMPPLVEVDAEAMAVRVAAGLRYAELARRLDHEGFALRNLGSLPHISVAGSCATGTHGSGVSNGGLATAVRELEMVTAEGDLIVLSRAADGDRFNGAVVSLGSLGVVVSLTLDLVPSFVVQQTVYEGLELDVLDEHFVELVASAYSVSLFTDWRHPRLTQIWLKRRSDQPEPAVLESAWFTAGAADGPRHPLSTMSPASCSEQLGVPGRWFERLPHFRPEFTPSSGEELQSEYFVARQDAVPALHALERIRAHIHPVLQICEVRTVAADELWMSPSYGRDTVTIHFTWIADETAVLPVVALVEAELAAFGARPHWGKVFRTPAAALPHLYERLPDFCDLVRQYDAAGKFRNGYTERYLSA